MIEFNNDSYGVKISKDKFQGLDIAVLSLFNSKQGEVSIQLTPATTRVLAATLTQVGAELDD